MACFFIVDTYIDKNKGRGSYDDYIEQVKPIVESYGGEYLARSENVTALSPLRKPDRVIIIRFPRSVGAGIQTPAVSAMIPSLVPEDKLMKINGYNASIQSAVQFAAPAAAGLVLSAHRLKYLIFSYGLFILLCVPAGFLCSLYVTKYFSDSYIYLSGVELAGFAGMTAGGLIMASFAGKRDRMKIYGGGIAGFGVLAVLLASTGLFPVYLSLMVVFGIILTVVQTASTTFLQENTRGDMIGRVFGQVKGYETWVEPCLVSNTLDLLDKEIPRLKDKIESVQLCFTTDPFIRRL